MEKKETKKSVFETLSSIDCTAHVERKNNLSYLSWAWAWAIAKQHYPDASYTVYEGANGCLYHTDGKTCWVKTGVTIEGQELIEFLPVMGYKNQSIPLERVTSFDANKAIQRSLTKAIARHGLGLYIYAGEDLPTGILAPTDARVQEGLDAIEIAMFLEDLKGVADKFSDLRRHNEKFDAAFNAKYKIIDEAEKASKNASKSDKKETETPTLI